MLVGGVQNLPILSLFINRFLGLDKYVKQKNECPFCRKKVLGSIKSCPNVKVQEMMEKVNIAAAAKPQQPAYPPTGFYGNFPAQTPSMEYKQPPFSEVEKCLVGAKYFIIKSSNYDNIDLSIKHSEWATTKNNEV